MSCGIGGKPSSDLALLWLWCRPAAVTLTQALTWEPPYVMGAALKEKGKKNKHTGSSMKFMQINTKKTT